MVKLRYRGSRVNFLEDQVSRSNSSSSSSSTATGDHSNTNNRSSEGQRQFETGSVVERIRYRGHILKSNSSIKEKDEEGNKHCNPNPTKIILSKKGEKDGILWIIVSIIPIIILYLLSTNSLIANLGKGSGSDPKTKMLQKMVFNLSMKKQQEDMWKEYRFMEAIEDDICHDYPTLDMMLFSLPVIHQQKHNSYYSGIGRGQSTTKNRKQTKNDMVRQKRGFSTR
jgi:hypothetical protein